METPGRDALITTKLGVQARSRRNVDRERLRARLDTATEARLVLVSAPAGFGKSTLLADWLGQPAVRGAWLSLDTRDNDIVRFARYLAAATARLVDATEDAAEFDAASFDPELALAGILEGLAAAGSGVVLVLDDYHVIEEPAVHRLVTTLVERLPPGARLAIATRADPPIPLARLRARGELLEVRAEDLRFTAAEAAALVWSTGVELPTAEVEELTDRTEGWAAALRLAAVSLRGRPDHADAGAAVRGEPPLRPRLRRRGGPRRPAARVPRSSSCAPRSSTACAVRCARPSPENPTARRGSRSWSARTC